MPHLFSPALCPCTVVFLTNHLQAPAESGGSHCFSPLQEECWQGEGLTGQSSRGQVRWFSSALCGRTELWGLVGGKSVRARCKVWRSQEQKWEFGDGAMLIRSRARQLPAWVVFLVINFTAIYFQICSSCATLSETLAFFLASKSSQIFDEHYWTK